MKEIKRDVYLNKMIEKKENGLIKVVTGIRRCGKSFLLDPLYKNYLLDNGVKEDHIIKLELDELKEKEYDKILEEHRKKIDEMEKEKAEKIKNQIMREKEIREAQMKDDNVRKKIELLKNKKFERSLVKTIQENIENDKKAAAEKKLRENQALNNAIRENEIRKKESLDLI